MVVVTDVRWWGPAPESLGKEGKLLKQRTMDFIQRQKPKYINKIITRSEIIHFVIQIQRNLPFNCTLGWITA